MNIKKTFFSLGLGLFFVQNLFAGHYLNILQNNGNIIKFDLDEKPEISFSADKMIVKSNSLEISTSIDGIKDLYFTETSTSVGKISTKNENTFSIFNISGQFIEKITGKPLNLKKYPKGVYIIKSKNRSFKVINNVSSMNYKCL